MIGNTLISPRSALVALVILLVIGGLNGSARQSSAAEAQSPKNQSADDQSSSEEKQDSSSKLFVTDPFRLESGLATVTMTHQGGGDFIVNLLSSGQEETAAAPEPIKFSADQNGKSTTEAAHALAKETGPVTVSRAVNIPAAGSHILDIKADGPWAIEVTQPHPSSAPSTTKFSGSNDAITPFFELSKGVKQITTTNLDEEYFGVDILDKDGNTANYSVLDKHKDQASSGQTLISWTVDVPEDGIYLFDVRSENLWTIEVADAEQPADTESPSSVEQATVAPTGLGTLIFLSSLAWILVLAAIIRFRPT